MSEQIEDPQDALTQTQSDMALKTNTSNLMSQITDIVNTTKNETICRPEQETQGVCTDEQWLSILDQRLTDTKMTKFSAPETYKQAQVNYLSLKDHINGTDELPRLQMSWAKAQAEATTKKYKDKFDTTFMDAVSMLSINVENNQNNQNNQKKTVSSVKEGFTPKNAQVNELYQNLKAYYEDYYPKNVTNNRKTYYESEALLNMETWNKILFWGYYIVLGIWILCVLFIKKEFSLFIAFELILLALYPFIIDTITHYLYDTIKSGYDMLPSNVYNNI
jgi:hypothetical protein